MSIAVVEKVLCVPAETLVLLPSFAERRFAPLTPDLVPTLLGNLEKTAVPVPKDADLETGAKGAGWLQLVVYGVLCWRGDVLAYRRGGAGDERRLHGLASLGIGGHVNTDDLAGPNPVVSQGRGLQPAGTLFRNAIRREADDELRQTGRRAYEPLGLLYDDRTDRERRHLGVIFRIETPQANFVAAREIIPMGWTSPAALARLGVDWEPWSAILVPLLPDLIAATPLERGEAAD